MEFVKVYTTDWCPDCKAMLGFFESHNIAYEVINVQRDEHAVEQLRQMRGGKTIVPTVKYGTNVLINPSMEYVSEIVLHQ